MRLSLLVLALGLSITACKEDRPAQQAPAVHDEDDAAARRREREEMMKTARDRAEAMHGRIDGFEERLRAAQAKLASAKTDEERKAAEDEIREIENRPRATPAVDAGSKTIDLKCAKYPLGKCPD